MKRLSEELKEEIRRLQESGMTDAEISRKLGVPYHVVHYQRPEVKEKKREYKRRYMRAYMRKYYQIRTDPDFQELKLILKLLQESENGSLPDEIDVHDNIYISILECLKKTKFGLKHSRLQGK